MAASAVLTFSVLAPSQQPFIQSHPMLKGSALLTVVEGLPSDSTRQQLCKATGYFTTDGSGKTRYMWNTLQTALLEAKGLTLPSSKASGGPRPSYVTQTLSNGNVSVGRCYAKLLKAGPGDTWNIEVDEDSKTIKLVLAA